MTRFKTRRGGNLRDLLETRPDTSMRVQEANVPEHVLRTYPTSESTRVEQPVLPETLSQERARRSDQEYGRRYRLRRFRLGGEFGDGEEVKEVYTNPVTGKVVIEWNPDHKRSIQQAGRPVPISYLHMPEATYKVYGSNEMYRRAKYAYDLGWRPGDPGPMPEPRTSVWNR